MNIEDLTLKEIRVLAEQARLLGLISGELPPTAPTPRGLPFPTGSVLLVRTVTNYYTGELVSFDGQTIVLMNAAWIPNTGRFSQAVATGVAEEVEPYPDNEPIAIPYGATIDISRWGAPAKAAAPRKLK